MDRQEFKPRRNLAVVLTLGMVLLYTFWHTLLFISDALYMSKNADAAAMASFNLEMKQAIVLLIFAAIMTFYFVGCRPYLYVIEKKEIISKKRWFKDKHLDLMKAEIVTDPVPRLADLVTRPHAIEIYDMEKRRHKYFPVDAAGFTNAVVKSNKRIHCTVKSYTDRYRKISRRDRRENERRRRRSA
jgi:hypothetical protein